jgi:hypothetical protein
MNSAADFTRVNRGILLSALAAVPALGSAASVQRAVAQAQQAAPLGKPNTLVIMGDDVGWFNVRAYHQGIVSGYFGYLHHFDAMSPPKPFPQTKGMSGQMIGSPRSA